MKQFPSDKNLYEIKNVKQHNGEPIRRWFFAHMMDLYIWLNLKKKIIGFQLCYDKPKNPHALTWFSGIGYKHNRIDDGDKCCGHKEIRILTHNGKFNKTRIARTFSQKSRDLPPFISKFVYQKIVEYTRSTD